MVAYFSQFVCYNGLMPKHLIPVLCLVSATILLVMLNFTTPLGVGPLGVLVFFTTFYALMFGLAVGLVSLLMRALGKSSRRRLYLYAAALAFGPVLMMLLQAMGSMSLITIGLVVVFVFLCCFLISKRTQTA